MTSILPMGALVVWFFERVNPLLIGVNMVMSLERPLPSLFGTLVPEGGNGNGRLRRPTTDDYRLWIAYWLLVMVTSFLFDLIYDFLPFANELRLLWVLWLYHPKFRGALLLLEEGVEKNWRMIQPAFDQLEELLKTAQAAANSKISSPSKAGGGAGSSASAGAKVDRDRDE